MDSDICMTDFQRYAEDNTMPVPIIENEPHFLISRVRQYYLKHITKLLCENYEKVFRVPGKVFHLPSGIAKCAQLMEIEAARSSMIVDLYRKSILLTIGHLKSANKQGKIHKQLLKTCKDASLLNKRTQTSFGNINGTVCKCQCTCKNKIKTDLPISTDKLADVKPPLLLSESIKIEDESADNIIIKKESHTVNDNPFDIPVADNIQTSTNVTNASSTDKLPAEIENNDEVMLQLELLFNGDHNGHEEDLFDSILCCNNVEDDNNKKVNNCDYTSKQNIVQLSENADKIPTLEDRLAIMECSGVLNTKEDNIVEEAPKQSKHITKKWICEIYFRKLRLFERLDEIRDVNRKKYKRIHDRYYELFGFDSDDEEMMSPLVENRQFILSCQERFAPWIVEALTPYYVKGRIKSKALFKSTAKHLIKIIYQMNKYPKQYEVTSFVQDFLKHHSVIRCEADFRSFTIPNYNEYQKDIYY